jgi:hypothetical protein
MDTGINGTEGQVSPQPSAQAPTSGSAPEGYVEIARLNGALQKIQELTLANRTLTDRLTALTGEKATLTADLQQKESAWQAQQSEFTTKLASAEKTAAEKDAQLSKFQAMQLKMKIIGELGATQLYSVMDVIPDTADEASLKASIEKLAKFAGQVAQTREKELTAGVTTIEQNQGPQLPSNDKDWEKYINSMPFGSPEYQKAMDQWHSWLFTIKN